MVKRQLLAPKTHTAMKNRLSNIARMYTEGFRQMTVGRSLWVLILLKLVILFAVLKLFFFPDLLSTNYDNDSDRAQAVRSALSHH